MSRTWLYADPHFFHQGVCRFTNKDGSPLRPWDDAEEMSLWMIEEYNKLVNDEDRVYILGDVAMNRKALDRSIPFLKGRKVLVKGNHDIDKLSYYTQYFDDVRAYVPKKGFILSHIPLHPGSLGRWGVNIHGHLHSNSVKIEKEFHYEKYGREMAKFEEIEDTRYVCVSVEHTEFKPILLDTILTAKGLKDVAKAN